MQREKLRLAHLVLRLMQLPRLVAEELPLAKELPLAAPVDPDRPPSENLKLLATLQRLPADLHHLPLAQEDRLLNVHLLGAVHREELRLKRNRAARRWKDVDRQKNVNNGRSQHEVPEECPFLLKSQISLSATLPRHCNRKQTQKQMGGV